MFFDLTPLVTQKCIKFLCMYATPRRTCNMCMFYCTDQICWIIYLSACPSCFFVFLNLQAIIFQIFWWNVVYWRVLAQGKTLLKMVRIGTLFRPFPIESVVLKNHHMSNSIKQSAVGYLMVGGVPLQYI